MGKRSSSDLAAAWADILGGLAAWRIWTLLGTQDVRQRYRRSTLGPLWVSISMAITVAAIGFIWANLFSFDRAGFIPYLCIGTIIWNSLVLGTLNEGCSCFISGAGYIRQIKQHLFTFVCWVIFRNLIIFGHSFAVFLVVLLIFGLNPGYHAVWAIPGMVLLLLNVAWMGLFLAILGTRFRDIPEIVRNLFTVLYFITPIMYKRNQLGEATLVADLNPFTSLVEIIRSPLLGEEVSAMSWYVSLALAFCGWAVTILLFARVRTRIPYWL